MHIQTVALVFDRYDTVNSIKQFERNRRGNVAEIGQSHKIEGNRKVPNYQMYMKNSANKQALAIFVNNYVVDNVKSNLSETKSVI